MNQNRSRFGQAPFPTATKFVVVFIFAALTCVSNVFAKDESSGGSGGGAEYGEGSGGSGGGGGEAGGAGEGGFDGGGVFYYYK